MLLWKLCWLASLHAVHDLGKTLIYCRRSFSTHSRRRYFFLIFIFSSSGPGIFRKLCRQAPNATCHLQNMEKRMSRRPLRWVTFQIWEDGGGVQLVLTRVDAQVGRLPFPPLHGTLWYIPYGILSCHTQVKSGDCQPQLRKQSQIVLKL